MKQAALTPAEQAKTLLGGGWMEALEAHLLHGYVFSTPAAFLIGRPVPRGADVGDLWQVWPREACDAWFVWIGIGRAPELLAMMPRPLPWIGWNRLGRAWSEDHWIPATILHRRFKSVLASAQQNP